MIWGYTYFRKPLLVYNMSHPHFPCSVAFWRSPCRTCQLDRGVLPPRNVGPGGDGWMSFFQLSWTLEPWDIWRKTWDVSLKSSRTRTIFSQEPSVRAKKRRAMLGEICAVPREDLALYSGILWRSLNPAVISQNCASTYFISMVLF